MINETFMRLDDWSLRLDPETPLSVRKECRKRDQVVITESRIDGDLDRDTLTRAALFRGPILKRSNQMTEFGGAGMEWFLGDAAGYGPLITWSFLANRTWANWVSRITSGSIETGAGWAGLTYASGIDIPATVFPDAGATDDGFPYSVVGGYNYATNRELLEIIGGAIGVEWDITPDGIFQAVGAGSGNYWQGGSGSTPLVVIMRGHEGRDINLIGLEVVDLDREEDSTRTPSDVAVLSDSAYASTSVEAAWRDVVGDSFKHLALERSTADTSADVASLAADRAEALQTTDNYRAVVREWYPGRFIKPGDYVWAFDDICEINSSAEGEGILYRGEWVAADTLRCYGIRWAIREGMGVYRLSRGDPATYETDRTEVLDITDYVLPEDGDCELIIGSPEQSIADILGLS